MILNSAFDSDRLETLIRQSSSSSIESDSSMQSRIHDLYLPIFSSIYTSIARNRSSGSRRPLIVGLSAPQGCGKTTLTNIMTKMFKDISMHCVALSLDDFYLEGQKQELLASTFPSNPLLKYRGNAGTHDLQLAMNTLKSIINMDESVRIPRYDKSLRSGLGDRVPCESWDKLNPSQLDVVLFEGWMLGFTPLSLQIPKQVAIDPNIQQIDELLLNYEDLNRCMDTWIVLSVNDVSIVYQWRLQAEIEMRSKGKPSLTDDQVRDFISRFMPSYETYLPYLYRCGPQRRDGADFRKIIIGPDRLPIKESFPSKL